MMSRQSSYIVAITSVTLQHPTYMHSALRWLFGTYVCVCMLVSLCIVPFILEDWKGSCMLCAVDKVTRRLCSQMKPSSLKCKSELCMREGWGWVGVLWMNLRIPFIHSRYWICASYHAGNLFCFYVYGTVVVVKCYMFSCDLLLTCSETWPAHVGPSPSSRCVLPRWSRPTSVPCAFGSLTLSPTLTSVLLMWATRVQGWWCAANLSPAETYHGFICACTYIIRMYVLVSWHVQ